MDTLKRGVASKKVIKLYPQPDQAYALLVSLPVRLDGYLDGDSSIEAIEIVFDGETTTFEVSFLRAVRAAQDRPIREEYPPE